MLVGILFFKVPALFGLLFFGGMFCLLIGMQQRRSPCPQCRTRISKRAMVCPQCHSTNPWGRAA